MQEENNFEILILNKIYETFFFSEAKLTKEKDYYNDLAVFFYRFVGKQNDLMVNYLKEDVESFITTSNFLKDPSNKECFPYFTNLDEKLRTQETFNYIFSKYEGLKHSKFGFIGT